MSDQTPFPANRRTWAPSIKFPPKRGTLDAVQDRVDELRAAAETLQILTEGMVEMNEGGRFQSGIRFCVDAIEAELAELMQDIEALP